MHLTEQILHYFKILFKEIIPSTVLYEQFSRQTVYDNFMCSLLILFMIARIFHMTAPVMTSCAFSSIFYVSTNVHAVSGTR